MWRSFVLLLLLHHYAPITYGVVDEQHFLSLERVRNIACTPTHPLPVNPYHPSRRASEISHISSLSVLYAYVNSDPTINLSMGEHDSSYHVENHTALHYRPTSLDDPDQINNTSPLPNTLDDLETLRHRLSEDALYMVNKLQGRNRRYTTYICVALKEENHIKRFVFHNGERSDIGEEICIAVKERGYHLVQAERAHAEGQFLQYIFQEAGKYSHVIGIGCSRLYCPECDCLLSLLLGATWRSIASAATRSDEIQIAQSSIVDTSFCRLYKLPPILKKLIQIVVGRRLHFGKEFLLLADRF